MNLCGFRGDTGIMGGAGCRRKQVHLGEKIESERFV